MTRPYNIFTAEEHARIKKLWPLMGIRCAAQFPGKTREQLKGLAKRKGLRMLRHGEEQSEQAQEEVREQSDAEAEGSSEEFLFTPNRRAKDLIGNLGGIRCVFVFDLAKWSGDAGIRISKPSASGVGA